MPSFFQTLFALLTCPMNMVPDSPASNLDTRSIVEAANKQWNLALNSGNAKALAECYCETALLSPGNGTTLHGRTAIQQLFQSFIDNGVHEHTLEIIEVQGDANRIYQVARWGAHGADDNGIKPAFGGITTSVLEKQSDGRWLASSHVWNVSQ